MGLNGTNRQVSVNGANGQQLVNGTNRSEPQTGIENLAFEEVDISDDVMINAAHEIARIDDDEEDLDDWLEEDLPTFPTLENRFSSEDFDSTFYDMEGLIDVEKGERLSVLQKDLGSGWTCVRNQAGKTGFVPTTVLM